MLGKRGKKCCSQR